MVVPANRRFHFAGELMLIQSTVAAIDFSYAVSPRLRRSRATPAVSSRSNKILQTLSHSLPVFCVSVVSVGHTQNKSGRLCTYITV